MIEREISQEVRGIFSGLKAWLKYAVYVTLVLILLAGIYGLYCLKHGGIVLGCNFCSGEYQPFFTFHPFGVHPKALFTKRIEGGSDPIAAYIPAGWTFFVDYDLQLIEGVLNLSISPFGDFTGKHYPYKEKVRESGSGRREILIEKTGWYMFNHMPYSFRSRENGSNSGKWDMKYSVTWGIRP
ncbi:MAG: hypothetical protein PHQ23_14120 [Candidatus Wallbacteria bacterium]|nr:hypothetical protein [Candidatus Wallbacteria bacterium]